MKFQQTKIEGVYLVKADRFEDSRGYFERMWDQKDFSNENINVDFNSTNSSYNKKKGTLRGLHYQVAPHEQDKLVTCTKGKIFDVVVDIRENSKTYLQSITEELSPDKGNMLFIPKGCAHGFITLEDNTFVHYHVAGDFSPSHSKIIRWDDPALKIKWPINPTIISEKDNNAKSIS